MSKTYVAKADARNPSKQWINLKDSNQTATPELLSKGHATAYTWH